MDKIKQITIKMTPLVQNIVVAACLLAATYVMAWLIPSCFNCARGDASLVQIVHLIFTIGLGVMAIGVAVRSLFIWMGD